MQAVESADTELWSMASAEFRAEVERVFRHVASTPQSGVEVPLKGERDPLRVSSRHSSAKDLTGERVCPFGKSKRGQVDLRTGAKQGIRIRRMLACNIYRYDEAGVSINDQ